MHAKINVVNVIIVLLLSFLNYGCLEYIGAKLISQTRPSYQEVMNENSLPPLPKAMGRLFLFKGEEVAYFGSELCLDTSWYGIPKFFLLGHDTWIFVNLNPGRYSLREKDAPENVISFDLKSGDEIIVEVGEDPYLKQVSSIYATENFKNYNYWLPDLVNYDNHPIVERIRRRHPEC